MPEIVIPFDVMVFERAESGWTLLSKEQHKEALEGTPFRKVVVGSADQRLIIAFGPTISDEAVRDRDLSVYYHESLVDYVSKHEASFRVEGGCWCRWTNRGSQTFEESLVFFSGSGDYGIAYILMQKQVIKALSDELGLPVLMYPYNIERKAEPIGIRDFMPQS